MSGYLELILGPMFSGKTTFLINKYNELLSHDMNVAVINFADDKRYHESMLSSHDKMMIPCIFTRKLADILYSKELDQANAVLINEGQFFEDLHESVIYLVEQINKRVYVCGLDGDFKRQKFGTILDLIPICDNVIKLKSKCEYCRRPALFSHRITSETNQISIGSNNYVPLCRICYVSEKMITSTFEQDQMTLDIL
jgi:thymidine kinase